ncbi:MAG: DUF3006 domain-containing protein [Gemmatimonadota bacterium]
MPNRKRVFYAVDRVEGSTAVVVGDDGKAIDVNRSALPARAREGTVLHVALAPDGSPDWSSAELDEGERQRRLKIAEDQLKKLSRSDSGGDIQL